MSNLSSQPPSGQTRSLTEVFILLRNNAIQSKHIFANQSFSPASKSRDDREHLISADASVDIERGGLHDDDDLMSPRAREPPEWVSVVDELQYELSRVRTRQRELRDMQAQHLNRPSFSDDTSNAEEMKIDAATAELTRMLGHCNSLVRHVQEYEHSTKSAASRQLLHNTCTSLLSSVQHLTEEIRTSQQSYLKRVQARDDSVQQYFTHSDGKDGVSIDDVFGSGLGGEASSSNVEWTDNFSSATPSSGPVTMAQLQMIEQNDEMVRAREADVIHITKSIIDLNTLFKDVAGLIAEQGTILDRIDYNIEQTDVRVKSALQSVTKAEQYQRGSRKMKCIVLLACAIIFMLFMFLLFKF